MEGHLMSQIKCQEIVNDSFCPTQRTLLSPQSIHTGRLHEQHWLAQSYCTNSLLLRGQKYCLHENGRVSGEYWKKVIISITRKSIFISFHFNCYKPWVALQLLIPGLLALYHPHLCSFPLTKWQGVFCVLFCFPEALAGNTMVLYGFQGPTLQCSANEFLVSSLINAQLASPGKTAENMIRGGPINSNCERRNPLALWSLFLSSICYTENKAQNSFNEKRETQRHLPALQSGGQRPRWKKPGKLWKLHHWAKIPDSACPSWSSQW